jgi:hypothetical protein
MIVSQKPYNENEYVKLGSYNFEIVKDYTYFGTILINKNELRPETEKRIRNANRKYYALLPLPKSQSVHREEKIKICETIIRPVATDRAKCWTMNNDIHMRNRSFKMNVRGN